LPSSGIVERKTLINGEGARAGPRETWRASGIIPREIACIHQTCVFRSHARPDLFGVNLDKSPERLGISTVAETILERRAAVQRDARSNWRRRGARKLQVMAVIMLHISLVTARKGHFINSSRTCKIRGRFMNGLPCERYSHASIRSQAQRYRRARQKENHRASCESRAGTYLYLRLFCVLIEREALAISCLSIHRSSSEC